MKVLNVGGNNKDIPLPAEFNGYEHHVLDIDPTGNPDICCDARSLESVDKYIGQYDAVYCSHNLEHYHSFDVEKVLNGFFRVLRSGGYVSAIVPNLKNVLRLMLKSNLELEDTLYRTGNGTPIAVGDVLFGWQNQIQESGVDFFSHKWGFSSNSIGAYFHNAGFKDIQVTETELDIFIKAFKG